MVEGNRKCSEFADDMESLLGLLMDISDVLIRTEFIVSSKSKIFQAADLLSCHGWTWGSIQ